MLNLTDKQKQEMADRVIESLKNKDKRDKIFLQNEIDKVMQKAYCYLTKECKMIDDEALLYCKSKILNEEEFYLLFRNIMYFAESNNKLGEEVDNPFDNQTCYLKYKDLNIILRKIWGQGTAMQMRIDLIEDWNEELSFTYDEFIDWSRKEILNEKNNY